MKLLKNLIPTYSLFLIAVISYLIFKMFGDNPIIKRIFGILLLVSIILILVNIILWFYKEGYLSDTNNDKNILNSNQNNDNSPSIEIADYKEYQKYVLNPLLLIKRGENKKALQEIDFILNEGLSNNKELYYARATCLEKLGFYLDAIDDYNEYLNQDPKNANIYFLRGLAKSKIGEDFQAEKDLKKSIELNPNMEIYQSSLRMIETFTKSKNSNYFEKKNKESALKEGKLKRRKSMIV